MRILCVCKEGNSRSVQFAHLLKYWGNDCISIGTKNTTAETMTMLCNWADTIIFLCTEQDCIDAMDGFIVKSMSFIHLPLEDIYPRPFNKELHSIAKNFLADNKDILKCST